jgi:serine/threonine protein kinase
MDFVEGEDLQQMLDRRGPLPETEVLPWIAQICDALAYLHGQPQPIIHRDIKPANIKIAPDGQPMLVDFGIAKLYDPALRTMLGARAVTPGYSPPEQYGQERTDIRSDVYSLGATLYALLTGEEPADSVQCLIGAAALTPPKQLNPHISEPVAQVIVRAMASEPTQRFQSANAFKAALASDSLVHSTIAPAQAARAATRAVGVMFQGCRQSPTFGKAAGWPRSWRLSLCWSGSGVGFLPVSAPSCWYSLIASFRRRCWVSSSSEAWGWDA